MVAVADVRALISLEKMTDEEITPHLLRATRDYAKRIYASVEDEIEAVSCLAIYYIVPLLWVRIQARVNEYNETMETFKDVDSFQTYWSKRSESVPYIIDEDNTPASNKFGKIGMGSY